MADDDTLAQNNVVMSDPQQAITGGPRLYDPTKAMLLLRNPEAAVNIFAAMGAPVPPDAKPGITHQDASQGLGAALAPTGESTTPQGGMWMTEGSGLLTPQLPSPDPFDTRVQAAPSTDFPSTGPYHRGSQDVSGPTPSPESVNSGGAVPAPATSEKPGDLSKPDPVAPTGMRMTHGPDTGPSVHPDKTVDGLAKALAGLQGMTPKPFLPSTPGAYHPSNPLSRSTLPQQLMAEILGAAKPTSTFRLGEALRGRSYA